MALRKRYMRALQGGLGHTPPPESVDRARGNPPPPPFAYTSPIPEHSPPLPHLASRRKLFSVMPVIHGFFIRH